jgi:hypothetical protein
MSATRNPLITSDEFGWCSGTGLQMKTHELNRSFRTSAEQQRTVKASGLENVFAE